MIRGCSGLEEDFGVAGLFSFMVYGENLELAVEFRVLQLGTENSVVSYGFKGTAVQDIKNLALEYRNALARQADIAPIERRRDLLDSQLAEDAFNGYPVRMPCGGCAQKTRRCAGRTPNTSSGRATGFSFTIGRNKPTLRTD
jgi:hypothetical protein